MLLFPEHSAYLWSMAGFLVYYCLDRLTPGICGAGPGTAGGTRRESWGFRLHVGGFAAYAWLLTFFVGRGPQRGWLGIAVYAAAMGLHLLPVTRHLVAEYGSHYERVGAPVLAASAVLGGAFGLCVHLNPALVSILVGVVAGGVIVNTAIAELPTEKEGRSWAFVAGAAAYSALLLCLSHLEEGG